MTTQNLITIIKAEKALEKVTGLLKIGIFNERDLQLFTDLRQKCNLFDFEMEQKASELPNYNT